MLLRLSTPLLLAVALAATSTNAQFSCTIGHSAEDSCLDAKGDDGAHCVWCNVAGFGFCASEDQAEKMEETLPNIACDRYSGDNDDATTDDATPTDDNVAPSDDSLPDDFWTCLQKKTSNLCTAAGCTWCDSKGGFGLCMTGPTAESADTSDFFDCKKSFFDEDDLAVQVAEADPTDTTCLVAYLQDPTPEGCAAAADSEGNACEYCSVAGGVANVCLNAAQAQLGEPLGITCDAEEASASFFNLSLLRGGSAAQPKLEDPMDTACLMAFLQDPTEDGCKAAVDSDGEACEFCTYQGTPLCLNQEQAQMGEQFGMECEETAAVVQDPYDPSCALAFLQDPSADTCKATMDADGNPCKYCQLNGALNLCLTEEQADVGKDLGIECDDQSTLSEIQDLPDAVADPYDYSCALAYLQDQSPDGCKGAMDQDGQPCEYCTFQGQFNICLNADQAAMGSSVGLECDYMNKSHDEKKVEKMELPPDFFDCLENYEEHDCNTGGCTWCNTEVGVGFCMADSAARAMSECDFFSCDTRAATSTSVM